MPVNWFSKKILQHKLFAAMLLSMFVYHAPASAVQSEDSELIPLDEETDTSLTVFPAKGKQLLIWIPSFATPTETVTAISEQLQHLGVEVWYVDLLEARFLPKTGSNVYKIPDSDILVLLNRAFTERQKSVFIYAESRAAIPALRGLRSWQLSTNNSVNFGGLLLNSPYFYVETPDPGKTAQLMPIVGLSNLPIFILQPEYSPRYWQLRDTVPALEQNGSDVYVQILKNVRGRFHFRPDATETENRFTENFGQIIYQSMNLLSSVNVKQRTVKHVDIADVYVPEGKKDRILQEYQGDPLPPPLMLSTLDSTTVGLEHFKNQVVLVNFWATWCPPCVHEMPSMQRLSEKLIGDPFVILGVNIAEEESVVKRFLQTRVNVDFPILMDITGDVMRQWNVMAFPTSFVIDKRGKIRYALFGSVDWDTPEIISKIESLIEEK